MPVTKLTFGPGGVLVRHAAGDGAADKGGKGAFVWTDLAQPTEDDLTSLQQTFGFHPLTIEDCRHFNQRAKVEEYDPYIFITMAIPELTTDGGVDADELHAFLGADFLVTVHDDDLPALEQVRQRVTLETGKLKMSPDFLLYLISDALIDQYFPVLDDIEETIGVLEDEIVARPDRDTLNRIFSLKQQLVYLRKTAAPERELFYSLSGRRFAQINGRTEIYFRDIYDHMVRIYEVIETSRDLLGNALDAYLSVVSNRLNEVMRRLTIIATIFMPLSFIVGFGGMNFTALPFDSPIALFILLSLIVLTPLAMMMWFLRRDWL